MKEGRLGRLLESGRRRREDDALIAVYRAHNKGKELLTTFDISIAAIRANPPTSIVKFLTGGDFTLHRALDRLEKKDVVGSHPEAPGDPESEKVYFLKRPQVHQKIS